MLKFIREINKPLLLVLICALSMNANAQSPGTEYGDFPYFQSFLGNNKPTEVSVPEPQTGSQNSTEFTSEGLQLTPAQQGQFGAIFVNNRRFSSINGIKLEFEYMMYSGTGADGMSVFLFDASVNQPKIGARGAGIGYAYNRTNNKYLSQRSQGLTGGYLGIAFDSYGNFKGRRFQGESRVNGINEGNLGRSHVTLRGAKGVPFVYNNRQVPGMGDGFTGYPVLITQSTLDVSVNRFINTDGKYNTLTSSPLSQTFNIRGGSKFVDENDPNYRKAIIELYPSYSGNTVQGMSVTVKIQHGKTVSTIIEDYLYKTSFDYEENALPSTISTTGDDNSNENQLGYPVKVKLNAGIPEFLRIGFAAATGAETDIHMLRNLIITLPGSAEASDDTAVTYQGYPVEISPLVNDVAYTGVISKDQVGKAEYVDEESFRFITEDGTPSANPYEYTSSQGKWVYNKDTQRVTFTPSANFVNGKASVKYDIRGGLKGEQPYVDEAYRSVPATISVTVNPRQYIISNRMTTPDLN